MKESAFQASLIRTIKNLLPGCIVLKLDPKYIQGIPDILVLHGITWAALECKKSEDAPHRPNQDYYVDKMQQMSYSTFVYPENVQQVLKEMVSWFDYINTKILTAEDVRKLKLEQGRLNALIFQNDYLQVNMA